jgi:Pyruvate/2-oxoacid:ferredoxin oxidoreductase delta subunit
VPCSASRVVPGAHRVVGPGTHRGSGPREVHTTDTNTDWWAPEVDPFIEIEETRVHITYLLSSRHRRHTYTANVSFCRDKEETCVDSKRLLSSRQRRHAYTRCVSFCPDRGDMHAKDMSLMLSSCNGLDVCARYYQSPLWAQRNIHFM